jgi:hypothetical protein
VHSKLHKIITHVLHLFNTTAAAKVTAFRSKSGPLDLYGGKDSSRGLLRL